MITHILKDGTVLKDITGHTVTRKDAPTVYTLMERKGVPHEQSRAGQDLQTQRTHPSETLGSGVRLADGIRMGGAPLNG